MGYHMEQMNSSFAMKRANEKGALAAVKALSGKETIEDGGGPHFAWVDHDFAERDNLHDIMLSWRWELEYDNDGNVDAIWFAGEKIGDDELLFNAIAPFVEAGSFIEMMGEDGTRWKWVFDGKTCTEHAAETTYEDDEFVSEQEQRRFTALLQEFLTEAQEITVQTGGEEITNAVKAAGSPHNYIVQMWQDFLTAKKQY
jgi:hypothetical protein